MKDPRIKLYENLLPLIDTKVDELFEIDLYSFLETVIKYIKETKEKLTPQIEAVECLRTLANDIEKGEVLLDTMETKSDFFEKTVSDETIYCKRTRITLFIKDIKEN